MADEAVGFTAEDAGRIGHAVRAVEADPGPAPLGRQYGARRGSGGRMCLLLETFEDNDQRVKACRCEYQPDTEIQRIALKGNVAAGTNHPDSSFHVEIGGVASGPILGDATAAEFKAALVDAGVLPASAFDVVTLPEQETDEIQFGPSGQWWVVFGARYVENNGTEVQRHGQTLKQAPAIVAGNNNLEVPDHSEFSNQVTIHRTNWKPTDSIVNAALGPPYFGTTTIGSSTQLQQGIHAFCGRARGDYIVLNAENYFLRLFLSEPRR